MTPGICYGIGIQVGHLVRLKPGHGTPCSPERPTVGVVASLDDASRVGRPANLVSLIIEESISPYSHLAAAVWRLGIPVLSGVDVRSLPPDVLVAIDYTDGLVRSVQNTAPWSPPIQEESPSNLEIELWAEIDDVQFTDEALAAADGASIINVDDLMRLSDTEARSVVDVAFGMGGAQAVRTFDVWPDAGGTGVSSEVYLGYRGVRLAQKHGDYYERFFAVMERLACPSDAIVMLPMVSSREEVDEAREALASMRYRLGITIETPAAVASCYDLLDGLALVEVGINDLSQYVLAWDRDQANERVMPWYSISPAVLTYLDMVATACRDSEVDICVGLDLRPSVQLASQLRNVGVRVISAPAPLMPAWRRIIRS